MIADEERASAPLFDPDELPPKLVELLQQEVERIEPGLTLQARVMGNKLELTVNNGREAKGGLYDLRETQLTRDVRRFIDGVSALASRLAHAFRREREREEIRRWRAENGCDDGHKHDWRRGFYRSNCRRCGLMVLNDPPGSHPTDKAAP